MHKPYSSYGYRARGVQAHISWVRGHGDSANLDPESHITWCIGEGDGVDPESDISWGIGGGEIYELSQVCIWGGAVGTGEHFQALG